MKFMFSDAQLSNKKVIHLLTQAYALERDMRLNVNAIPCNL